MNALVANTGSTSLKLRLVAGAGEVAAAADLPAPGESLEPGPLREALAGMPPADAVGHRIVHGGPDLREPLVIGDRDLERLEALRDLAPLHNGPALAALAALRELRPAVPHVACFDTAFHSTLPEAAALYALPRDWTARYGLRRYGFHGISHAWAARRAAEMLGSAPRLVTCHLGGGASLAAVAGGRSVDTTMGFTPNEGLVMATRSGSVDPGMLVWLLRDAGVGADELGHALEHESGLRGLSGTSGDMREVIEASASDRAARTALDVYLHRLRAGIAAMAAAMDGLDGLVFTGGVGERSAVVRGRACEGLGFLGVRLDRGRNDAPGEADRDVSDPGSAVRVLVVESREELEIAAAVRAALAERA